MVCFFAKVLLIHPYLHIKQKPTITTRATLDMHQAPFYEVCIHSFIFYKPTNFPIEVISPIIQALSPFLKKLDS